MSRFTLPENAGSNFLQPPQQLTIAARRRAGRYSCSHQLKRAFVLVATPPSRVILSTLLAVALAGCQTIKALPPTGRVIPCSTVAEVAINEEAIDHLSERAARQLLGNDRVIGELCRKKK